MTTLFLAVGVLALCFGGLAIGMLFHDRPLKGSCGGPRVLEDGTSVCCQNENKACESVPAPPNHS